MRMKIISYNAARIASLACSLLGGFLQSPIGNSLQKRSRLPSKLARSFTSDVHGFRIRRKAKQNAVLLGEGR
jgi:hypothetical protein